MSRLGALREREFRLLFTGQLVSLLGDRMTPLALAFAVLDLTGSASDLGYVTAAYAVPFVAFLLVGGVFADRLPRRAVMLSADLVRLGTQGVTAGLLISGHARIWELIVLQAGTGTASAFFYPAGTGLTPMTVSAERLQEANGLRSLAMSGTAVAGPAISGALVAGVGPGWALAADAASFGVSAFFLGRLRLPAHVKLPPQSFLRDLRDGWREFSSRTWVWAIAAAAALGNGMTAVSAVLGPYVAKQSLGGAGAWALIRSAYGLGSFAGGIGVLRLRPRRPLLVGSAALLPLCVPSALLALRTPAVVIAAASLAAGAGLMLFNALWETTLQQQVPPAALSRVSAYDMFGSLAAQPLGLALAGPIAAALSVRATLLGSATILFASCFAILAVPSVRAVGAPPRVAGSEAAGW